MQQFNLISMEGRTDWIKFCEDIKAKFEQYGIRDYYLKEPDPIIITLLMNMDLNLK